MSLFIYDSAIILSAGEETYENMSYGDDYDDANYEAVDYENAIVVLAKKQSTGELSSPSN